MKKTHITFIVDTLAQHGAERYLFEILKSINKKTILNSDYEQLSRVIFNLVKNGIESIQEKTLINGDYKGIINIDLYDNSSEITLVIIDNGMGFKIFANNIKDILNPYFTTKKTGTGLGLAIVNKIINDHNGSINFMSIENKAKVVVKFKI